MNKPTRRLFNHSVLSSLLTYSVLETMFTGDVFADAVKPITASWLGNLSELSGDLKGKELTAIQWQSEVEKLMKQVIGA